MVGEIAKKNFERELKNLKKLHHVNIITFFGACFEAGNEAIVTEFMTRGDLNHLLHEKKIKFKPFEILSTAIQIANGMSYLHRLGIVHRNIKPASIFLSAEGVVKVAGFNFSKTQEDASIMSTAITIQSVCYLAPEGNF